MKELLISNTLYGASKNTPAVANSATSPDQLAAGAVGFYYMDDTTGKLVLLTAAVTGNISETTIVFCQGTATGNYITQSVKPRDLSYMHKKEFTSTVRELAFLGFNGVAGTLNLNLATLVDYADAGVQVISRLGKSSPEEDYTTSSAVLASVDVAYTAAGKVVQALNADGKVSAYVVANIAASAVVATGTVSLTKGSNIITGITGGTGIAANNYLSISIDPQTGLLVASGLNTATGGSISNQYKIVAFVSGTVTLDRPYEGASYAPTLGAFNASATYNAAAPTSVGIAGVSNISPYQQFELLGTGEFKNATRTTPMSGAPAIGMFPGSGTVDHVLNIERAFQINSGYWATADAFAVRPTSYVTGAGYDLYFMKFNPRHSSLTPPAIQIIAEYFITIAVVDGAGNPGGNATIEAILASIASIAGTPVNLIVAVQDGDLSPSA